MEQRLITGGAAGRRSHHFCKTKPIRNLVLCAGVFIVQVLILLCVGVRAKICKGEDRERVQG